MNTAVGVSAAATSMATLTDKYCIFSRTSVSRNPVSLSSIRFFNLKPSYRPGVVSYGLLLLRRNGRSWQVRTACFMGEDGKGGEVEGTSATVESAMMTVGSGSEERDSSIKRVEERTERKKMERRAYLVAAMLSSFGFTSMAIFAVYYRFSWQMEGGEIPVSEMFGTFALSVGALVGMEFWARWAHRALWHASLWHMHESHHRPREGPFELNDVFAIINAVPAIALLSFGFFHSGLIPGLCFGAGLGITLFGMAYMFVHDGLVHRRFPVGPIANVPYFRRVAAAHQIHHSDKFDGVPYGLFLGPMELEEVGGGQELEKEISRRINARSRTVSG